MDQNQAKNAKKNENFFSLRLPFKKNKVCPGVVRINNQDM